jgi:hypothetical protein
LFFRKALSADLASTTTPTPACWCCFPIYTPPFLPRHARCSLCRRTPRRCSSSRYPESLGCGTWWRHDGDDAAEDGGAATREGPPRLW